MSSLAGRSDKRRVVVGAAGTATAFGVVRTLREHWPELEVIAADTNPAELVATAALADDFVRSVAVADPGYEAWLTATLAERAPAVYVPLLDDDIAATARLARSGALGAGIEVVAPPAESAAICADKLATYSWLAEHGLPGCPTWAPDAVDWDGRPLIAKPRHGQGSAGLMSVDSAAELAALRDHGDLVVQPRCEPPEVTIDVVRREAGVRAIARERLETKAGVCTKARVFESDELARLARPIVEGLELRGASCIQAMRSGGGWVVTDVNARPGASTRMSTAAGVDILATALAQSLRLPLGTERLDPLAADRFVVRQYEEYVVG